MLRRKKDIEEEGRGGEELMEAQDDRKGRRDNLGKSRTGWRDELGEDRKGRRDEVLAEVGVKVWLRPS
jgi:hypothetical protein